MIYNTRRTDSFPLPDFLFTAIHVPPIFGRSILVQATKNESISGSYERQATVPISFR
jgi:hypothetical protein